MTDSTMNTPLRGARAVAVTIAFCVLASFCEGIDLQAAGVAASGIAAEFKPDSSQMGTFFSGSTLGLFFGALIGGRLAALPFSSKDGHFGRYSSGLASSSECLFFTCCSIGFPPC
jgi:MFS transporter, AAHS family, 3-hydroxyphenylpropionic acid transporter